MNIISMLSCYKPKILKDLPKLKIGKSKRYRFGRRDKVTITKINLNKYHIAIEENILGRPTYYIGPISVIKDYFGYDVDFKKNYGYHCPEYKSIVTKDNIVIETILLMSWISMIEILPDNIELSKDDYPYIYVRYRCFGGPYVI